MAMVNNMKLTKGSLSKAETSVEMECVYNEHIFIMRTRGSNKRSKLNKVSQIIHLDKQKAQELYELLDEFINFIPLNKGRSK